jgi:hypothetical protein
MPMIPFTATAGGNCFNGIITTTLRWVKYVILNDFISIFEQY